jgi:hypothetical protein
MAPPLLTLQDIHLTFGGTPLLQGALENALLIQNAAGYMASDGLTSLRAKRLTDRPFEPPNDTPKAVATLLGIRCGARYVMIRISNAGDKWSNCSPGRLIIERTMAALHRDGVREFDFSIGNYAYKRRFGVTRLPLVDVSAALSWRGLPYALRDRAARELRSYPKLSAWLKRALGKPLSREEN